MSGRVTMHKGRPKAPQNSHELAVRNQFFTPRYVVQFLTDNTLGRIWYEMRQGRTRLADSLEYLVRRPNEVFLAEGEEPPAEDSPDDEELSQEERLKKPHYVRFRPKKDPRDLRILDPACGSGHFLLYAFDLLLTIYEEAWADEASPRSELTGRTLREDYPISTSCAGHSRGSSSATTCTASRSTRAARRSRRLRSGCGPSGRSTISAFPAPSAR